MHKSKGNSIAFDDAAEALGRGGDALHLHRAEDRAESQFSRSASHRQRRPRPSTPKRAASCSRFGIATASSSCMPTADGWKPGERPAAGRRNELDRWVLSRLQRLVDAAQQRFPELRALPLDRSVPGIRRAVLQLVSAPLAPPLLVERQRSVSDAVYRADHRYARHGAGAAVPHRGDLSESGPVGGSIRARVGPPDPISAGGCRADRRGAGAKHRSGNPASRIWR